MNGIRIKEKVLRLSICCIFFLVFLTSNPILCKASQQSKMEFSVSEIVETVGMNRNTFSDVFHSSNIGEIFETGLRIEGLPGNCQWSIHEETIKSCKWIAEGDPSELIQIISEWNNSSYYLSDNDDYIWFHDDKLIILTIHEYPATLWCGYESDSPLNLNYEEVKKAIYPEPILSSKSEIPLEFKYGEKTINSVFNEKLFSESAYKYKHDLARLTLFLELASFTPNEEETWGDTENTNPDIEKIRGKNIYDIYQQMGFTNIKLFNYKRSLSETADKVGYSFAKKKLSTGEVLITAVIRGGGYGNEWVSNFNVGTGSFHEGFNIPAMEVYQNLLEYIADERDCIKLWITGYSRGGAVANLLGAKLDVYAKTNEKISPDNIFVYTFATPQGVKQKEKPNDSLYRNIFNIVNPADLVPLVAPSSWGYGRYGITKYFNEKALFTTFRKANQYYHDLTGFEIDFEEFFNQEYTVNTAISILTHAYPSRKSADGLLAAIREFMEYEFIHVKDAENSKWRKMTYPERYEALLNKYGDELLLSMYNAEVYLDTSYLGGVLSNFLEENENGEDILICMLSLLELNGASLDDTESAINSVLNVVTIVRAILAFLQMGERGVPEAHYPEQYLTWINMPEADAFALRMDWKIYGDPEEDKVEEEISYKSDEDKGALKIEDASDIESVQGSKSFHIELKDYIGTDINAFCNMVGDMRDVSVESARFENNYLACEASYGSDNICFLLLKDTDIEYSLYGIYIGMPENEAKKTAQNQCSHIEYESNDSNSYVMKDGSTLYFYDNDGKVNYLTLSNRDDSPF